MGKKEKEFDKLNQSKWMKYEDDIIKYYYKSLKKWLDNGMKKSSFIQFTSGLGRDIASLMEDSKRQSLKDYKGEIVKFIDEEIKKEEDCQKEDVYQEQELEHINRIEMANKIKTKINGTSRN